MMKHVYFILFLVSATLANSQTKFATVFGSHMVLQRDSEITVWGWDKPGRSVAVSATWGAEANTKADASGKWTVNLTSGMAGGPYKLTALGSDEVVLDDILLGEVWLCSGQSNMEMALVGNPGQPITGSNQAILTSHNDNLRFFKNKVNLSKEPVDDSEGTWTVSTPRTSANFSATAYFFGRMLQEVLNVPVGLVCCSYGGSSCQAWTPNGVIEKQFPKLNDELLATDSVHRKTPTVLYNGMINPIVPFTFKGVIWYQGEANRNDPEQYRSLFPAMISSWREALNNETLPFYFAQIATLAWGKTPWVEVQQAQLHTMLTVPYTGMAVTFDGGKEKCIHPPNKKDVGERLAYWALAKDYGFDGISYASPTFKSMKVINGKATLIFDNAPLGLCTMGQPLDNIEIAGADGKFQLAKAKLSKYGVLQVWHDDIPNPKVIRYGWKSYFKACLYSTAGLPLSPFTTDMTLD